MSWIEKRDAALTAIAKAFVRHRRHPDFLSRSQLKSAAFVADVETFKEMEDAEFAELVETTRRMMGALRRAARRSKRELHYSFQEGNRAGIYENTLIPDRRCQRDGDFCVLVTRRL